MVNRAMNFQEYAGVAQFKANLVVTREKEEEEELEGVIDSEGHRFGNRIAELSVRHRFVQCQQ